MPKPNLFDARKTFTTGDGSSAYYYDLNKLTELGIGNINQLPFSIKVLLESALRNCDDYVVTKADVEKIAKYNPAEPSPEEIAFKPARVILQDFTGVPCVVDFHC